MYAYISVKPREYPWTAHFNMLYVDNPVRSVRHFFSLLSNATFFPSEFAWLFQAGTGFSFTDNDAGYAKYETDVARDLYKWVCLNHLVPYVHTP